MKLSAIALDYDGTIAFDDALDPLVRASIGEARRRGIKVLLVTGRILEELQRVAGDLRFVDGVVAENGAVVHFADSGFLSLLAPGIPPVFTDELRRRGIPARVGRCLVDAAAVDAPRLLEAIRDLELPLVLAFNRSRVMVLAQGTSKATGLHATLDMMRVSARNMLAVGDAENDHPMLALAEYAAAVEWGSLSLREMADQVVPGRAPAAVAAFLGPIAATGRLPIPVRTRRRLTLGTVEDGAAFSLAIRGRNILIAGDARSGKSWIAGLLCEQLIVHGYSLCVLDPEGDYAALEALPGVAVHGGDDPPPEPRELMRALQYPDRSVVVDLSHQPQDRKIEYIRTALPVLNAMRRSTGLPHRIVVDEAHYFLHDARAHHLLDLDTNGYVVVTYNASRLPPELLAKSEVVIVTRESDLNEIEALRQCCATCEPLPPASWAVLSGLEPMQAVALPVTEETGGALRRFTIGPRLTPHVRHREKYIDVPVAAGLAFVFSDDPQPGIRARTLREFVEALDKVPQPAIDAHLRRGDFSRWVADVFGDRTLASLLTVHEQRAREGASDLRPEIENVIRRRYDVTA